MGGREGMGPTRQLGLGTGSALSLRAKPKPQPKAVHPEGRTLLDKQPPAVVSPIRLLTRASLTRRTLLGAPSSQLCAEPLIPMALPR